MQDLKLPKHRPVWLKSVSTVGGGLLILAGLVMLVTPGPGLVAIVAGLAVWAQDYHWARRWLDWARRRLERGHKSDRSH